MDEDQFQRLFDEIVGNMQDSPGSNLDLLSKMANHRSAPQEFRASIKSLESSLEAVRLILGYLIFDLEATRRERDAFKTILEDQQ